MDKYSEWIQLVAQFTIKSLQSWQVMGVLRSFHQGNSFVGSTAQMRDCSVHHQVAAVVASDGDAQVVKVGFRPLKEDFVSLSKGNWFIGCVVQFTTKSL